MVHFGVEVPQDCILGNFSAVPAGLVRLSNLFSQDYVLGCSEPSPRDSSESVVLHADALAPEGTTHPLQDFSAA